VLGQIQTSGADRHGLADEVRVIAMLKRVLYLACPPSLASPPADALSAGQPPPLGDTTAERERLRFALAAVKRAEQVFEDAKAATARVRALVDAAEPAQEEAKEAAKAAAAATKQWALAGATGEISDEALMDRAADTNHAAYTARLRAAGAEAALPGLEQAEEDARVGLYQARDRIKEATTAVLVALVAPQFDQMEDAKARYLAARESLEPLRVLLRPWGGGDGEFAGFSSPTLVQRWRAAEIHLVPDEEFIRKPHNMDFRAARYWANFAKQLMSDPDAAIPGGIEDAT
jgi:hypothetical protein